MKKGYLVLAAALLAALVVLPGPAKSEMYVEGYLGGNFAANAGMSPTFSTPATLGTTTFSGKDNIPGRIDPAFMGGLKFGYWFVKEGFLGYNYPEWAKYFGVYLDFSAHRLNFKRQTSTM